MAARTTDSAVRAIIDTDVTITDLGPFITMANELTTECCAGAIPAYTDARLELIERLLAAHFYVLKDPRVDDERAEEIDQKFQYKIALGLNQTFHGQMAMRMDTAGGLAALEESSKNGGEPPVGIVY
ncbi:MAG TPA: hypothetical protein VMW91_01530, partial [Desulfosporosinus sp.]|nr:hypothetical protein [Desulfosporosinus sp.]